MALLLWATIERFGAPQPAPPAVSAGRLGLLQNIAKLLEFSGHQDVMIRRYVLETVRDVGPPAARAARALDARHWSRGCSASARRAAPMSIAAT